MVFFGATDPDYRDPVSVGSRIAMEEAMGAEKKKKEERRERKRERDSIEFQEILKR